MNQAQFQLTSKNNAQRVNMEQTEAVFTIYTKLRHIFNHCV